MSSVGVNTLAMFKLAVATSAAVAWRHVYQRQDVRNPRRLTPCVVLVMCTCPICYTQAMLQLHVLPWQALVLGQLKLLAIHTHTPPANSCYNALVNWGCAVVTAKCTLLLLPTSLLLKQAAAVAP